MKKHLIILAFLPLTIAAQNSPFTREVEVERDYIPSVGEATRLPGTPQTQQPAQEKPDAPYSVWTNVAEVSAPKQNLPAAELPAAQYSRGDRFIRLGAGNYTSFLGDLFIPVISNERTSWIFDAGHRSTFGKITLDNDRKVQAKNNDNIVRTALEHRFDNSILSADARFNRRDYNYYGVNSFIPETFPEIKEKAHFNDFSIGAGLRSLYLPENNWDFNASLHYNYFKTQADFAENHVAAKGGFLKNFNNDNIGINAALDFFSYANAPQGYFESNFKNYAAVKLNPYYTHFFNDLEIRLGLNAWFAGKGEYSPALSPDVKVTFNVIENRLQLFAYAQGDYALNSVARIMHENPYTFALTRAEDTYTPFDLGAGAKVKITDNIVAKGSLGYKLIKNEYFYFPLGFWITDENNNPLGINGGVFDIFYSKVWQFYTNISLEGNWSDRFNTLLTWNYNHYSEDIDMWRIPQQEIRLSANYKLSEKINLSASGYVATRKARNSYSLYYDYYYVYVIGDYYDIGLKHNSIVDFSLGGTYKINNTFTAFLQLNNIFANKYHIWYGYNAQRFNAMAGLTVSF